MSSSTLIAVNCSVEINAVSSIYVTSLWILSVVILLFLKVSAAILVIVDGMVISLIYILSLNALGKIPTVVSFILILSVLAVVALINQLFKYCKPFKSS